MKVIRDFTARPEQEQLWLTKDTWCEHCQEPDLGMVEPVEYEQGGGVFVEGRCVRCGSPVVTQVKES